ncbi:hypothetical protein K661_00828 [Piscirickettsia salmonis LF-89 = ATCC VR-1361]|nr:hypothetical protein K661_00828 [Piscirickettsia salmonis LF-89 = ATCC VR-1361]
MKIWVYKQTQATSMSWCLGSNCSSFCNDCIVSNYYIIVGSFSFANYKSNISD